MGKFIIKLKVLFLFLSITSFCYGADCEKALFGWTASDGTHIEGTLANEGVSEKNPRGFQNLEGDSGNYRNGKNCGGTAFGIACGPNPAINVRTIDRAGAVKFYHDNQWAAIHGDDLRSQYLAYKLQDLAINMGTGTAIILFERTINDLNGKGKDFPLNGSVTAKMIDWVNTFTAPQTLIDGTVSNVQRWWFFDHLKGEAYLRYGDLIAKNPKLRQFWDNWKDRAEFDR